MYNGRPTNKTLLISLILIMSISLVSGCLEKTEKKQLSTLRVGILPDQVGTASTYQYKLILERISNNLNIPYEIITPKNYNDLTILFKDKKIDLAYFGAVTFIKAHNESNALPLVMRDIDMNFTTHFIVHGDSSATTIEDLKGKVLSFGSKLSTSGHLMPRHFMLKDDIQPENYFSKVLYSGSHDKTISSIKNKEADLGAVNSQVVEKMLKNGKISNKDIRILYTSPPYPDYVWAIQSDISDETMITIRETFTDLMFQKEGDKEILQNAGAKFFYASSIDDFSELISIINKLHILENK